MSTIVYRRKREWPGRGQELEIELDGKSVGTLRSKGVLRSDVSSGTHSVRARMGGASSHPVEVIVGDATEVTITFQFVKHPTFNMVFKPEGSIEAHVEFSE